MRLIRMKQRSSLFATFVAIFLLSLKAWSQLNKPFLDGGVIYQDFEKRFGLINENLGTNKEITIMMATSHYRDDISKVDFFAGMQNCPKKCRVVSYASSPHELLTADALIFHLVRVDFDIRWFNWLSKRRRSNQLYVLYSMEPPVVLLDLLPGGHHDFRFLKSQINWTMGYQTDADVSVSYSGLEGFKRLPIPTTDPPQRVKVANKRHIAAVISNCAKWNYDRIAILKELAGFGLQVDILGVCGSKMCPGGRAAGECYQYLEEKYLFYASFENSICQDYVTEKFPNILGYDMVPIVIGGANYSAIAPPHSFINLQDFKSASNFASFLLHLANDEDAYNKYFEWKQSYRLSYRRHSMFCSACIKLHQHRPSRYIGQYYIDLDGWLRQQCSSAQVEVYKGSR